MEVTAGVTAADLDGGGTELKLSYRVITNRSIETKPWQRANTDARGDSNYLHGGSNDPAGVFLPGRILEAELRVEQRRAGGLGRHHDGAAACGGGEGVRRLAEGHAGAAKA